jgi:hypothetical protein
MTQSELIELLQHNVCNVTFVKVDGTERTMPCTLNETLIPVAPVHATNTPNSVDFPKPTVTKKANPGVVTVWCTDAAGWRSFRWDNFVTVTVLDQSESL